MARKLIVEIVGDATKLTRSFNQSTTAANKFGAEVSGSMGKAERSFTKLQRVAAGGFIGAAAFSAGVVALRKVIDAAAESEQVLGQTQVALESTGKSWERYGATIERAVAEQSRMGFDDEALLRTFSLFVRNAGSVEEALRRNNIAMDLSRARFIDLEQAAALVNKAALGQAGALRRVGIDAKTGASGIELLTQLEREFAGSAEQASGTATAAQERLQVSLENVQEAIGSNLTPAVADLAKVLSDAAEFATTLGDRLRALGAIKIPTLKIPFTTVEVPGTGGLRLGDIANLQNVVKFTGPQGVFFGTAELVKRLLDSASPPDTTGAAKAFEGFYVSALEALAAANEQGAKRAAKRAPAFGEKGFKAIDVNELGEEMQRAFDATLDALDLRFDRAVFAESTAGALAVLDQTEKAIRKRISTQGRTTELLRQLFEVEQDRAAVIDAANRARQGNIDELARKRKEAADKLLAELEKDRERQDRIREAAAAALQVRQFRAIGLAPGGGEIIPGIENLKKQLEQLSKSVVGEDVPKKLTNRLAGVRKTLAGGFGKVTDETRSAIRDLFEAIRQEFDKGATEGPLTKTTSLNTNRILEGLGLGRDTEKELRARLSGFNSAGLGLARGARPSGSFRGGQPVVIENHTTVNLDGETVGRSVTRTQQKDIRRNPRQKRGPNRRGGI